MPKPTDPMLQRTRPTDAELEAESVITEADVNAAISSFNLHCPPTARGLLDAREEGEKKDGPL